MSQEMNKKFPVEFSDVGSITKHMEQVKVITEINQHHASHKIEGYQVPTYVFFKSCFYTKLKKLHCIVK
jgi:hypothetical protein